MASRQPVDRLLSILERRAKIWNKRSADHRRNGVTLAAQWAAGIRDGLEEAATFVEQWARREATRKRKR